MCILYYLYELCIKWCYNLLLIAIKLGSQKRGAIVWYQSQGFDTEPRWASGAVFGLRMRGKLSREDQFRTLVCSKMSRSYLTSFKLRRYSGVMKPQSVWYKSTGREDSTPEV